MPALSVYAFIQSQFLYSYDFPNNYQEPSSNKKKDGKEFDMSTIEEYKRILSSSSEITSALEEIDHLFMRELSEDTTEEERHKYFYGSTGNLKPTRSCHDLLELWNELEPFVWMGEKGTLDKYWIIQVIREMNTAWQVYQLNREIDSREKEQMERLYRLLDHIEDLPGKSYLVMNSDQQTVYSLRYFDEQQYHPYRDYIIRHIINGAGKTPIYVVSTTGSNDFSADVRVYHLHADFKWEESHKAIDNMEYSTVDRNMTARRRGLMIGYTLNDL